MESLIEKLLKYRLTDVLEMGQNEIKNLEDRIVFRIQDTILQPHEKYKKLKDYVTANDIAEQLGVSVDYVNSLKRKIGYQRFGSRNIFHIQDVIAYLESSRIKDEPKEFRFTRKRGPKS